MQEICILALEKRKKVAKFYTEFNILFIDKVCRIDR
jgi:hypothetical protein